MRFDFIVPPLPQPIVWPEQPTAPERESIMGHGVPHNLGTEGIKSCLRRRRTVSSSKVEGIVTAELRARKLQPDRPIHYPTDSLLSWNNQVGPEERIDHLPSANSQEGVDTRGVVNWAGMLLCLCGARLALENLLTYGIRWETLEEARSFQLALFKGERCKLGRIPTW